MGIWNKRPDAGPDGDPPTRLRQIAAEKVAAAERFTAALVEAGAAQAALFESDRAFWREWNECHGDWGEGTGRLMRQLRPMLISDLELSAPELLVHLSQPRQSRASCETVASIIARQVENDLASEPQPKEPVT